MSRRKQAKPRAVFKQGGGTDDLEQDLNLEASSTKEEILSDILSDGEGKEYFNEDENSKDDLEPDEYSQPNNVTEADGTETSKTSLATNSNHHTNYEDEEVYFDEENTTDSYYSDLYSTHTSSTYSPSMSEGAATPNSLLHHHHHHHLLQHPHVHQHYEGEDNRLRNSNATSNTHHQNLQQVNRRGNKRSSTSNTEQDGNGNNNAAGEDNEEDDIDDEDIATEENGDEPESGDERIQPHPHRPSSGNNNKSQNVEPTSEIMGDGKISAKLRRIDGNSNRDDVIKTEKMTADGIKTATDGSYQCQFCDKSFPRLGYLKKHEQSHAEHLPFKCDYCARLFKHKRSRDRHTKLHTGDRRYRCPHCEAAFSRSDHLKIHMKTHDNQKPYQCTVCNRGYNTAAALTSHMQNHKKQASLLGAGITYSPRSTGSGSSNGSFNKRRYVTSDCSPNRIDYRKHSRGKNISCIYCTKCDFTSLDQLNAHIKTMHESVNPRDITNAPLLQHPAFQLSCEYCTMKFPNIPAMFQHMRTSHIDRLTSPNSYFEHFNRLAASGTFSPRLMTNGRTEELKVKLEEKSPTMSEHKTEVIEKQDEQLSPTDLSQPRNRSKSPAQAAAESPAKPGTFLCNQCNAALPDFDSFRTHLKSHIAQGVTTNLVCHHCGLTLRDPAEHERHVISHFLITNSEYLCWKNCNKSFPKPDDLQKHLFETHVQNLFKCSLCSEIFETKVAVQVHLACSHSKESKIFRCSACMETFKVEADFSNHVRSRHANPGSIQCMFCRAVCSSELEMHFHLAAHARQFRCPSCPETFHVEFLLDRHMQTQHSQKEQISAAGAPPTVLHHMPQFNKLNQISNNNNNSLIDYHSLVGSKALFHLPGSKLYNNPLQVETNPLSGAAASKHSALFYGLGQRYFDANKTLADMYNYQQDNKNLGSYFLSPSSFEHASRVSKAQEPKPTAVTIERSTPNSGFSCGICERSDFRTETEVHSHRKIVHNLKTGVSLRCAYCSGNFKSRSELEHHMKTCHNSTGKHKCLICDEIFPSPAILAEHKLQHSKVGQSGKCSHCSVPLNDVSAFKVHLNEHNTEGQMPVQCICCRQTLQSEFEIGLHAKFHTKSESTPENLCALCLESLPARAETRVCEKCCRKHNLNTKFNVRYEDRNRCHVENRCNLCKVVLPHAQRLQEHLVEHTFVGCEDRGFVCYICSAVFTVPAGLLGHMNEHGQNARPYDCNLCPEKYFFRAELENHLIEHEINGLSANENTNVKNEKTEVVHQMPENRSSASTVNRIQDNDKRENISRMQTSLVKTERHFESDDDDEEYIEVEKVPEVSTVNVNANAPPEEEK